MRSLPRRSPVLPLLVSLGGHVLLVAVLALLPAHGDDQRDFVDTEVHDGVKLSLDPLPEQRPPQPIPAEHQEPSDFSVSVVLPPISDGGPPHPTPGVGGTTPSLPGPAISSSLAGNGGRGLLAVPASVRSVVYVLDHSTSMGLYGALGVGRQEVLASLSRLPPGTLFQVIPYNQQTEPLVLGGRVGLVPLGPATYEQAKRALMALAPSGSTKHSDALHRGLALRPDLLFLVTDAGDLTPKDVADLTVFNQRRTVIHAVELTCRRDPRPDSPLQRLAADNGGTCRRIAPAE
jgi:hypothetical protein